VTGFVLERIAMSTQANHTVRKTVVAFLLVGVLGPPLIWAAHLQILYVLVPVANKTQSYVSLYATTVICCLLTLCCGFISWRDWENVRNTPADMESSALSGCTRFISVMGMASSVFFALTIFITGLATCFFKTNWD
jgi:hypothetical protein